MSVLRSLTTRVYTPLSFLLISSTSITKADVLISPGQSIQAAVNANSPGTVYRLAAGVHRMQTVRPRAGDVYIGDPGAVMNGAALLSGFAQEGSYWAVGNQNQRGQAIGNCDPGYERCLYPEELFIDGVRLKHVSSTGLLGPGRWYFDYGAKKILVGQNPIGHTVETSVAAFAFIGSAPNVTIRDLVIEKYASPGQHGAIQPKDGTIGASGSGWVVQNCDVRWNHGGGIAIAPGLRVTNSKVRYNGQIGFTGEFQRVVGSILIEGTEIAFNNQAGYHPGWEAGGTKFINTTDLTLRNNYVHDNLGPGLWSDSDNLRTTYDGNVVENNGGIGIFHEVSYDATIKNNKVRNNGKAYDSWLWGAQILVAASPNVNIYGNTVEVAADGGDGIGLIQQNRGSGKYGLYVVQNVRVYDNTVIFNGTSGSTGAAGDALLTTLFGGTNRFERNTYRMKDTKWPHFYWKNGQTDFNGMGAAGQESNSATQSLNTPTTPAPGAPSATPPAISAIGASTSGTGASISWTTDRPTVGQVIYSTGSSGGGSQSPLTTNYATSLSVQLAGLTPGATYTYQVRSVDSAGLSAVSPAASFSVPSQPANGSGGSLSSVRFTPVASSGNGHIWHMTWAADDTQYTSMSDGVGWAGTDYSSIGASTTPPNPTGTAGSDLPVSVNGNRNWIGDSLLAIGGNLYYSVSYCNRDRFPQKFEGSQILLSGDGGRSWFNRSRDGSIAPANLAAVPTANTALFWNEPGQAFGRLSFLQRGRDNASATDNYIYVYAEDGSRIDSLRLARVPKDRLLDRTYWEYFVSRNPDGSANWTTSIAASGYVMAFPSNWVPSDLPVSWHPSVVYNPGLKKYILAASGSGKDGSAFLSRPSALVIYTAETPWGPWSQVHFDDSWTVTAPTDRLFEPAFAPKWTSADGRTMYLVFSGTGAQSKFNVLRVDLVP